MLSRFIQPLKFNETSRMKNKLVSNGQEFRKFTSEPWNKIDRVILPWMMLVFYSTNVIKYTFKRV